MIDPLRIDAEVVALIERARKNEKIYFRFNQMSYAEMLLIHTSLANYFGWCAERSVRGWIGRKKKGVEKAVRKQAQALCEAEFKNIKQKERHEPVIR